MAFNDRWARDECAQDELRRYGLEHDPYAERMHEQELADRYSEQGSLAPGDNLAQWLARHQLGQGSSPSEQPRTPAPESPLAVGERIVHEDASGDRRAARVVKLLDEDAAPVVAFDRSGQTAVAIERLEREAA